MQMIRWPFRQTKNVSSKSAFIFRFQTFDLLGSRTCTRARCCVTNLSGVVVGLQKPCKTTSECSVQGSACDAMTTTCECASKMIQLNGKCKALINVPLRFDKLVTNRCSQASQRTRRRKRINLKVCRVRNPYTFCQAALFNLLRNVSFRATEGCAH